MKLGPKHTKLAGYMGYLTQALIINFPPLLFITFINTYDLSISSISVLISVSFMVQLAVDAFAAKFSSILNIRATVVTALILATVGITGYSYLPEIIPSPFVGLLICTVISSIGAGFVEVLISPIIEACPTDGKSAAMSILHSFYAWGHAGIIILSTLFFGVFGLENWRILACLWTIIPMVGAIAFMLVPIYTLEGDKPVEKTEDNEGKKKSPFRSGIFLMFFVIMTCAGAAEQAMAQWASTFAESGLGVSKSVGDILGPCAFALLMGVARVIYAKFSDRLDLQKAIYLSSVVCIAAYLVAALSPNAVISLIGCALCGLSTGIMWPGTYSLAAQKIPRVGIQIFALLALGGDLGCALGPAVAGWIAELFSNDLRISFAISAIFPLIMVVLLLANKKDRRKELENGNK